MLDPAVPSVELRRPRAWELALVIGLVAAMYVPKLGSYGLWDPWEGHYGEVARRMREEHDWLFMRWQNESFHSKPALTFWLMAAGMKAVGVGADGGSSGEFVASHRAEWGLRLPFALFGIGGIAMLWYALARLCSRRVAWLATLVLATSPYYFFISRQAITDMPSCALLVGTLALFALAIFDNTETRPRALYGGFVATFVVLVGGQLAYFASDLGGTRLFFTPRVFVPGSAVMLAFLAAAVGVLAATRVGTLTRRQVLMYWFYLLSGLAVLAKGPVAPGLAGLTILCYLTLTGDWHLLRKVEIPRGVLIALAICLPWHFAMYLREGNPWLHEYINEHLVNRAFKGVHGDRGTFRYFLGQLGVGMWPWACLLPPAITSFASSLRPRTREGKVRLLIAIWAVVGFFFFSAIQTKFHHYVLPAVPALAALVAFWLDDLLAGRLLRPIASILLATGLFVLLSVDLVPAQEHLVQLFIYRYDRTIPRGMPWNIDYTGALAGFACALGLGFLALASARLRRGAIAWLGASAIAFTIFAIDVLLPAATPHFGQRAEHEIYYRKRQIHGVDLRYETVGAFARDWEQGRDLEVASVIPETLHVGDPMTVTFDAAGQKGELHGSVARIGDEVFWILVPPAERQSIAELLRKSAGTPAGRRWLLVDADRLIAKLYWRGESFYSGGEIWNPRIEDAQTVFHELNDADNKKFLEYLHPREGQGRKFWVVTERGHLPAIRSVLPTELAKSTFRDEDEGVSSFFALASFTL